MLRIKDIMRAGHVTRWHLVRTARQQTLAEHLFMVAALGQYIYKALLANQPRPAVMEELVLLQWALRHDVPEVLIGDPSTPLKHAVIALANDKDYFKEIERDIDPVFKDLHDRVKGTVIEIIVKMADIQTDIAFLHVEGMGSHAKLVENKLVERHTRFIAKCQKDFPTIEWNRCQRILDDLIDGPDGMLEFEKVTT